MSYSVISASVISEWTHNVPRLSHWVVFEPVSRRTLWRWSSCSRYSSHRKRSRPSECCVPFVQYPLFLCKHEDVCRRTQTHTHTSRARTLPHTHMCMYIYVYIYFLHMYIERERERETQRITYMYTHTYIYICPPSLFACLPIQDTAFHRQGYIETLIYYLYVRIHGREGGSNRQTHTHIHTFGYRQIGR